MSRFVAFSPIDSYKIRIVIEEITTDICFSDYNIPAIGCILFAQDCTC